MINYGIIAQSVIHYADRGFERIESPWMISSPISNLTKPANAHDFTIAEKNKVLVASGEQSLLYLYNKGFLPKGQFQTITPCFRDETFTPYNTKYFIKNELMITDDVSPKRLEYLIQCARDFFREYCLLPKTEGWIHSPDEPDDVLIIETTNGRNKIVDRIDTSPGAFKWASYDLIYRGIELGSYGTRQCPYLTWIYGTGVAEPRLTRVMKKYGIPQ